MTAEELLLDETHAWISRARNDLEAARLLMGGDLFAEALFHSQQAVEKAMKAFLTYHQTPFRKTHALKERFPDILAIDNSLAPVLAQANSLSEYAWRFRYPGAPHDPERPETETALATAETTVREIERRLPAASDPYRAAARAVALRYRS